MLRNYGNQSEEIFCIAVINNYSSMKFFYEIFLIFGIHSKLNSYTDKMDWKSTNKEKFVHYA